MFFSSLELIGFKSFASRTKIEFRNGVMAVVGPNGCGKSNIVDAIRWVLGEQRYSILRAERMESVIFNGTQFRKPVGMSEVTLTIENNKNLLPSPYSEIAITRRLFRSGESEYLINRTPSRLRDIMDLFADTGLGNNTYSIIELSMVEGIISGPSEARRMLIEEAAGVAKFKARRNAAERRLANTRDSLVRIEDIYSETEKRYRALKRQASRAEKHRSLSRALELRILIDLAEERLEIQSFREPLEEELNEINREKENTEREIDEINSQITTLEGNELVLTDRYNRTQENLKRIDRREAEMNGEQALAMQRRKYLEEEKENSKKRFIQIDENIEETNQKLIKARDEFDDLRNTTMEAKKRLQTLESDFDNLKKNYESKSKKVKDARNDEEFNKNRLNSFKAKLQRQETDNKNIETKIIRLSDERASIETELAPIINQKNDLKRKLVDLDAELNRENEKYKNEQQNLEKLRERLSEAYRLKSKKTAEVESTKTEISSHKSRALAAVSLPKSLEQERKSGRLPALSERIICDEKYRSALVAALKPILDSIDRNSVERLIETWDKIGVEERAVFRIPGERHVENKKPGMPDNGAARIWADEAIGNDGELGDFLKYRLRKTLLAPDRKAMLELIEWAEKNEIRIVTLNGDVFEPGWTFFTGKINPDSFQIGWIKRKEELGKQLDNLMRQLEINNREYQELNENLKKNESALHELRRKNQSLEDKRLNIKRDISSVESRIERLQNRQEELDKEINRMHKALDNNAIPENVHKEIDRMQTALDETITRRKTLEIEFSESEQNRIQIAEKRAALSAEISRLNDRLNSSDLTIQNHNKNSERLKAERANLDSRIAKTDAEIERIDQAVKNFGNQLNLIQREKREQTEKAIETQTELDSIKRQRDELKRRYKVNETRKQEIIQKRSELESKIIALRERQREVDRRLIEDSHVQPTGISRDTLNHATDEVKQLGFEDISAEKIRTRLDSLGPVNMLALEELKTVEDKYKFLTDQKSDLENGIDILEETIDRINSEARRRFRETFDKVNINFQNLFRRLFSGGEARVQLEGQDPLEADIKILATPTGKKLQNLSMLSGGEKSLTAIALLFAIYEVRPSPFCILDEVDAPLDDTNVVRFNKLIADFSRNTQYMIVTHNKRTMTAAENLVGVTLGEDGTSHLVSVKIEKDEEESEKNDE